MYATRGGLYVPIIPGLPEGLEEVPHYHPRRGDAWREEWLEWAKEVERYRVQRHALCDEDRDAQQDELILCAASNTYFATVWGWTQESRHGKQRGSGRVPFIPYGYQVQYMDWKREILFNDEWPDDGFVSKSRGVGISWAEIMDAAHGWHFIEPWDPFFTSKNQDLVDKHANKHALFWKFDFVRQHLPSWMTPYLEPKLDKQILMRENPWNGNSLLGGATTKTAGVAGRATYFFYDELARVRDAMLMYEAGAGTADHRIAVSTETWEQGFDWWDLWHAARDVDPRSVLEIDWWQKPEWSRIQERGEQSWEFRERRRWAAKPGGFEREYGRDPGAASGEIIYPWAEKAPDTDLGYDPNEPVLVGFDPGRADACAAVVAQSEYSESGEGLRWIYAYERQAMIAEFHAHVLSGEMPQAGDAAFGLLTNRDVEAMEFFAQIPWSRFRWFGDPAGHHHETATGLSTYDIIALKTLQLRMRQIERWTENAENAPGWVKSRIALNRGLPNPVPVQFVVHWDKRDFESRRNAMRATLQRSRFGPGPGPDRIRQALKRHRFNQSGTGHRHDEGSNVVAACEYLAVGVSVELHQWAEDESETAPMPEVYDLSMTRVD